MTFKSVKLPLILLTSDEKFSDFQQNSMEYLHTIRKFIRCACRGHSFNRYSEFSKKQIFLTASYVHVRGCI